MVAGLMRTVVRDNIVDSFWPDDNACGRLTANIRLSSMELRKSGSTAMSSELRGILLVVAGQDYEREKRTITDRLDDYEALILEIAKVKRFDLAIWIEGSDSGFRRDETDLNFLERARLVKGEMKYTHRNAFHEYRLTRRGTELAAKLRRIAEKKAQNQPR